MLGNLFGVIISTVFVEFVVSEQLHLPTIVDETLLIGFTFLVFLIATITLAVLGSRAYYPQPFWQSSVVDRSVDSSLRKQCHQLAKQFLLSPREEEVLNLLIRGRSGLFIQESLYLSKSTVKTHIRHIYTKIGVSSRQQLLDKVRF